MNCLNEMIDQAGGWMNCFDPADELLGWYDRSGRCMGE